MQGFLDDARLDGLHRTAAGALTPDGVEFRRLIGETLDHLGCIQAFMASYTNFDNKKTESEEDDDEPAGTYAGLLEAARGLWSDFESAPKWLQKKLLSSQAVQLLRDSKFEELGTLFASAAWTADDESKVENRARLDKMKNALTTVASDSGWARGMHEYKWSGGNGENTNEGKAARAQMLEQMFYDLVVAVSWYEVADEKDEDKAKAMFERARTMASGAFKEITKEPCVFEACKHEDSNGSSNSSSSSTTVVVTVVVVQGRPCAQGRGVDHSPAD